MTSGMYIEHVIHVKSLKKLNIKHRQIPVKEYIISPWKSLCVDLIGPYTLHRKGTYQNGKKKHNITLWCMIMIDPVTC